MAPAVLVVVLAFAPRPAAAASAAALRLRVELEQLADAVDPTLHPDASGFSSQRARIDRVAASTGEEGGRVARSLAALVDAVAAGPYGGDASGLGLAAAETLRQTTRVSEDAEETAARAQTALTLERDLPATEMTLEEFLSLDALHRWLLKHRVDRPREYRPVLLADLKEGALPVELGVEVEGVVTHTDHGIDLDYNFSMGGVVMEINPEWRWLLHRGIHLPKVGERVRVRGWTYFDSFHKVEDFLDRHLRGREPELVCSVPGTVSEAPAFAPDAVADQAASSRESTWEIHPVQDVELLEP